MFRYLSLNSGVGSLDLALQRLQIWTPVCYVETNPANIRLLTRRITEETLQDAPIWDDFSNFDGRPWCGCVDCIAGIAPVKDATEKECARATANKLIGIVQEIEPSYILWQLAHDTKDQLTDSADYLANGFEILGYRTAIFQMRANDLGADYKRTQIYVCGEMVDSESKSLEDYDDEINSRLEVACRATRWTAAPRICRGIDGDTSRVERLNTLGTCSVPAMGAAVSSILCTGLVI